MSIEFEAKTFFSISFDLIVSGEVIGYDLYVNSSAKENNEKFVRIFPTGEHLSKEDLAEFKRKYQQLYVLETQRAAYLKNLVNSDLASDKEKGDFIKGSAITYLNKIFDEEKEFNTEVLSEAINGCRDSVKSMITLVGNKHISKVQSLIGDLSFHDFYTYDHSINVSMYCISIYKSLKPSATQQELTTVGLGGLLHDLGKIKISTRILNNAGKLSDEDFKIIQKHPDHGRDLLLNSVDVEGVDVETIGRVIHEHHENYNGTGYPRGLKEKDIHIFARITAIADFFDAITTKRSYHDVLGTDEALGVMARSSGKKIDPKIFDLFSKNVAKISGVKLSYRELPENFDPCHPQNVLEFRSVKPQTICSLSDKEKDKKAS